jgi:hypothetical protein
MRHPSEKRDGGDRLLTRLAGARDFLKQLSYLHLPTPVDAWLSAVIAVSESM